MWIQIEEEYLKYLRDKDKRIPYQEYGKGSFKPFFRLFKKGDITYVTQINHAQSRHYRIRENLDFQKLREGKKIIGVVNLNYMFPVLEKNIRSISAKEIRNQISYSKNKEQVDWYMELLAKEKNIIETKNIREKAIHLYMQKDLGRLDDKISSRCLDYRELETKTLQYEVDKIFGSDKAAVSAVQDFYFIEIEDQSYSFSIQDIDYLGELKKVHEYGYDKGKQIEIDDTYGRDM